MVYAIQVSLREDIVARSGRYTDEYEEEIRHSQVQDQQVSRVPHARVALHLGDTGIGGHFQVSIVCVKKYSNNFPFNHDIVRPIVYFL